MSPPALHEYAWMQTPPWQFVEQHSNPAVQEFPSVVQLETAVDTVAHAPEVQTPEQHWLADEQLAPTSEQAPDAQAPEVHVSAQHSDDDAHVSLAILQNASDVHFPEAQTVEQHCEPVPQLSPPTRHASTGGGAHVPLGQEPEQQWPGLDGLHAALVARHRGGGSVQIPFTHEFVQQFESEPQA